MSEVPEVVVEHCNGVDTEAEATDEANQNGDDGYVLNLIAVESSLSSATFYVSTNFGQVEKLNSFSFT